MEDRTLLSSFLVNTTADSGPGSLRQAILDSNAATGGTNTIDFDIPGQGVQTIAPASPLPAITNPVLIDGSSQPGYDGTPLIELDGSQDGTGDGLTITGPDVSVSGLDIANFSQGAGIHITGTAATGDWIYGNYLGTDPTGTQAAPNEYGVEIDSGASNNLVGTNGDGVNDPSEQNLISGNTFAGVWITGQGTEGNSVAGNFIGTTVTGDTALPNGENAYSSYWSYRPASGGGVVIDGSAYGNLVGDNVISGNNNFGVELSGNGTSSNVVQGNVIGTDLTGTLDLGNGFVGIEVDTGASDNTIGGTNAGAGNLITNNGGPGVVVGNSLSDSTVGDQITSNCIFGNRGQAIDLGDAGVLYNAPSPQQGPNNLQNFPIMVTTADGSLQGWLGGSTPDTTFRIDVFASAEYGPGGAGEAQDDLGSLDVTTDATGQVSFAVPFAAPAGLPIVTATATDPLGNTSELSAVRRDTLQAPTQPLLMVPGGPLVFSTASGDGIELLDPDAGPLDPEWNLALSVSVGTLTLASTAGLTGSGDGSGSLSYSGSLSALNSAMDGLEFTPPPGFHGNTTASLNAASGGASPLQDQLLITDGIFPVTTTADSGPGSLRQAILDSNAATTGSTNTIDFDIPGQGAQTIAPASPLPAITNPALIDGFSQPGYDGIPLIELSGSQAETSDGLLITGPDVTVRGLDINSFSQGAGIELNGTAATGDWITGNFLGTDPTGTQAQPNSSGVEIDGGASDNTIGGTNASAGNLITNNGGPGVVIGDSVNDTTVGDQVTSNSIFGNQGQAIDLGDDGVTYNASSPQQGPNNLQNFPIIVTAADGSLQGWLGGCTPDTTFRIDVFASAEYGPGGAGEAQDDLGSLEVTTDATGQVSFAVPFPAPAGLPIVTATATDPLGNTSEVSAVRQDTLQAPTPAVRMVPGGPLVFSTASGDGIELLDPDAGPLDPQWNLALSVSVGTLTLASTAGLTGSGDGSGSLSYSGPLSAINTAMDGLEFAPPPGFHSNTTLSLNAASDGTSPLQAQLLITEGVLSVTTTADSGPGSLRQAILDSNAAAGGTNTIDFDIPGQGVQTIAPASPLPAIADPVLIDGYSQPGYDGTPMIELSGSQAGPSDGLLIAGPDVTVRGLDINSFSQGAGIELSGTAATGDWIDGNFLGTDPTGTQAAPNVVGVAIDSGAGNDLVGTNGDGVNDSGERNLISGNTLSGVWIANSDGNTVAGNFIGTTVTGDTALPNGQKPYYYRGQYYSGFAGGVEIDSASGYASGYASGNLVSDNVISGNNNFGVELYGNGTSGNVVQGNVIGTDLTGALDLGNSSGGIEVDTGALDNTIGGTTAGAGNLITNNGGPGVVVGDSARRHHRRRPDHQQQHLRQPGAGD